MAKKSKKQQTDGVRYDAERAGALCVAFVNTTASRPDNRRRKPQVAPTTRIESYEELVTWLQRTGTLGLADSERLRRSAAERPAEATAVLERAVDLRTAMTRTFFNLATKKEPLGEDLDTISDALPIQRIVPTAEGFDLSWGGGSEALERVFWLLAESTAELLSSQQHKHIRQCATKGCFRLFVYTNRRRLWCDDKTCGSRARGQRFHRQRRKTREQFKSLTPAERRAYLQRLDEQVEAPVDSQAGVAPES